MTRPPPVPIVALDVASGAAALGLVDELGELCGFYKVGSELYTACGPAIIAELHGRGRSVFLDLKFHDIPNTVGGAVRVACQPGVKLLTVHAAGGEAMVGAAASAAREADIGILAVTVLTSLDAAALGRAWGRAVGAVEPEVLRLAQLARDAGAHGVVCSGHEARALRATFGSSFATLVPGIRLADGEHQDQARVVTPRAAADAGATYIVLGRAVTGDPEPRSAMEKVLADLS